jgi:plasmid stability protein
VNDFIDIIAINATTRPVMASMTIRNLDDSLKAKLRVRAAQHGRSMEEEARVLLRDALAAPREAPAPHLLEVAQRLFGKRHGVDLKLPPRARARPLPEFDE